jgi:hypothetical protein
MTRVREWAMLVEHLGVDVGHYLSEIGSEVSNGLLQIMNFARAHKLAAIAAAAAAWALWSLLKPR